MYWPTIFLILVYLMCPTVALKLPKECGSINITLPVAIGSGIGIVKEFFRYSDLVQSFPVIRDYTNNLEDLGKELSPVVGAIINSGAASIVSYCYVIDSTKKSEIAKNLDEELRIIIVHETLPILESILKVINEDRLNEGEKGFKALCHKKDGATVLELFAEKMGKIENHIQKSVLFLQSEVMDRRKQDRILQLAMVFTGVGTATIGVALGYAVCGAGLGPIGIAATAVVGFGSALSSYQFKRSKDKVIETLDSLEKILENTDNTMAALTKFHRNIENGCKLGFKYVDWDIDNLMNKPRKGGKKKGLMKDKMEMERPMTGTEEEIKEERKKELYRGRREGK